ncbi:MAG TPA: hypothetical protein VFS43_00595 [Polyangiaceae bacterium]|nr:hypothetical protein [Polyangiaceae bacterium]
MVSNGLLDRVRLDTAVTARLYAHDIGLATGEGVPCWSYLTEGLEVYRQREVVLTLRRAPGEERPPGDGIGLLEFVARAAKGGKAIDRGGLSEFGPRGFLGNASLRGLVYAPAAPLAGLPVKPGSLTAISLFGSELDVARRYGPLRVLSRLGKATSFFPFPPWAERSRQPVAGALESVLDRVGGMVLPDASVTVEGDVATLRLRPPCAAPLAQGVPTMPEDRPIALFPGLGAEAPACLVWSPGQSEPEAISLPGGDGTRFGACFVAFVAEQPADETRLFEDGVIVMLTDRSWYELRAALAAGRPYRLERGAGRLAFVVEWPQGDDQGPFAERLEAPAGWRVYRPEGLRAERAEGPVGEMQIIVFASDAELKAAVDAATLGEYVKSLRAGVRDVAGRLPEGSPGSDLVVEVKLAPDAPPAFAYGLRSLRPESSLGEHLPRRLERVPAPDVERELRFQILFPLWGGTGKPLVGGDDAVDRSAEGGPGPAPGGGAAGFPTH